MADEPRSELERLARDEGHASLVVDFWLFLVSNKKWWLVPLLLVLLLLSLLMYLSTTAAAPFIYTLF